MTQKASKGRISEPEFVALMAFLMSNVAFAIDAILPALNPIGLALQVENKSDLQMIIFMIFLGLGVGELIFGTLSDAYGRKPIVLVGVGIFVLASFIIVWAPDLTILLLGRFIQGIGLSAARSVSIAVIRDTYSGDRMARIMSFILTVFILIPMLAPLIGQLILDAYNWEAIFYFQLGFISLTLLWFWMRQNETLQQDNRKPISRHLFVNGIREFIRFKTPLIYTIISGLVQGAFIAYLGSAQQIFQEQYQMVTEFPYIFGGLALVIGISSVLNGSMVLRYGMFKLVSLFLIISICSSSCYILLYYNQANPSLYILISFLLVQFLSVGFVFGNLSALTMQPIGHVAGVGAALYSFIAMTLGVIVAFPIGQFISTSVLPLFVGFVVSGLIAISLMRVVKLKFIKQ